MEPRVHEISDEVFVNTISNARTGINARYAIRFGIVNWNAYYDPLNPNPVPSVWINYQWNIDGEEEWKTEWQKPAHIMLEDLTNVINAMNEIKRRNRIN